MARRSGWSTGPPTRDDVGPDRGTPGGPACSVERNIPSDPFEGSGAHRKHLRLRIEGVIAIALAIAACGLATALWFRALLPLFERVF